VNDSGLDPRLTQALLALIDVVDNCDYALDQLEGAPQSPYRHGLMLIRNGALQKAHALGLQDFTTRNGVFDTAFHEAVSTMPGGRHGQIQQVLRRGWTFEERTLRYAQVVVFSGGGPEDDDDDDEPPMSGRRRLR
jgi:molecular chaperone GrpE (heat shock protein)